VCVVESVVLWSGSGSNCGVESGVEEVKWDVCSESVSVRSLGRQSKPCAAFQWKDHPLNAQRTCDSLGVRGVTETSSGSEGDLKRGKLWWRSRHDRVYQGWQTQSRRTAASTLENSPTFVAAPGWWQPMGTDNSRLTIHRCFRSLTNHQSIRQNRRGHQCSFC
jgi:hypothetical protein